MSPKHTFHAPAVPVGETVSLPATEARHAHRVLRLGSGDTISLVDGAGVRSVAQLEAISKHGATARVLKREVESSALDHRVTLGAALLKNASRYETMIEKACELGADAVVPLQTIRTERSRFRTDRAEAIAVSAMKQSGSAYLTEIRAPAHFEHFVAEAPGSSLRLICHEATSRDALLSRVLATQPHRHIVLAVGPEGGFSEEEVAEALVAGFLPVSLGRARLRAETASIAALAIIAQFAQDGASPNRVSEW